METKPGSWLRRLTAAVWMRQCMMPPEFTPFFLAIHRAKCACHRCNECYQRQRRIDRHWGQ